MTGVVRIWFAIINALIFVWLAIMLWSLAPDIEAKLSPIVTNVALYEQVPLPDGTIKFRFKFDFKKLCKRITSHWYSILADGSYELSDTHAIEAVGTSRPLGVNISAWTLASAPGTYLARIYYDCGWPWGTLATVGPFTVRAS